METVNNLYIRALSLYDEISKNGEVNASKTADYKARSPYLADILQRELWNTADYTKILETSYLIANKWLKITLPINFMSIKKITILDNNDVYSVYSDYKLEKDGSNSYLYIKLENICTVKVQYKPYPTTILTIDDYVELDAITSTGITYGLCKYFAMSEQNEFVESICNSKFIEIKNNKVRVPAQAEIITDVYKVGE